MIMNIKKRTNKTKFLRDFKKQPPNVRLATVIVSLLAVILFIYMIAYMVAQRSQHLKKEEKATHAIVADAIIDTLAPKPVSNTYRLSNGDIIVMTMTGASLAAVLAVTSGLAFYFDWRGLNKAYLIVLPCLALSLFFNYLYVNDGLYNNYYKTYLFAEWGYFLLKYSVCFIATFDYVYLKYMNSDSAPANETKSVKNIQINDGKNENNNN